MAYETVLFRISTLFTYATILASFGKTIWSLSGERRIKLPVDQSIPISGALMTRRKSTVSKSTAGNFLDMSSNGAKVKFEEWPGRNLWMHIQVPPWRQSVRRTSKISWRSFYLKLENQIRPWSGRIVSNHVCLASTPKWAKKVKHTLSCYHNPCIQCPKGFCLWRKDMGNSSHLHWKFRMLGFEPNHN